jgi:two-component system response regulator RegX3
MMLTAKSDTEDRIEGLTCGADDYITKPFSLTELSLRIGNLLRWAENNSRTTELIKIGPSLEIDIDNLIGYSSDKKSAENRKIEFSSKEADLLSYLAANSERPVSRRELLREVWGYRSSASFQTRTVDIYIGKIRKKIEQDSAAPRFLITVRGRGYQLKHGDQTAGDHVA